VPGVAVIAEAVHQLVPGLSDAEQIAPARPAERTGEAVPGQRRDDDVEGRVRVDPVRAGIGQRPDQPEELHPRARPTARQHQGDRVGYRRPDVHDVDRLVVDGDEQLRDLIELRLSTTPVVVVQPVAG
jgi:hypothetical protein